MKFEVDKQLCIDCLTEWGIEAQINQMIEEASELITKLCHVNRGRIKDNEEIVEELADVVVMCAQMSIVFSEPGEVQKMINFKSSRVRKRLEDYIKTAEYEKKLEEHLSKVGEEK